MAALIKGETGDWEIVIGLEVHAQIIAKSKLFSGSSCEFGGAPNNHVSLVDAAMPGMLPVLNEYCVEQAVRTGLGLNSEIHLHSVFERKNYFYPDLPQGYQISQFLHPIVGKGVIEIDLPNGEVKKIGVTRLHMEQDAGKSIHDQHPTKSYVDLNRSGCALMEIVSEPDIRGADEACAYVTKLRMILRYLGTCDGNLEEGSMRADVNVSVRKLGDPLGTRCEIKNVNSIKAIQMAIDYEATRQVEIIEAGGKIKQETRLWDNVKGETRSMRSKEEAHDYRYFPDPDLLPLVITQDYVDAIKATLPELPDQKKHRFMSDFGLSAYDSSVLIAERARADPGRGDHGRKQQSGFHQDPDAERSGVGDHRRGQRHADEGIDVQVGPDFGGRCAGGEEIDRNRGTADSGRRAERPGEGAHCKRHHRRFRPRVAPAAQQ